MYKFTLTSSGAHIAQQISNLLNMGNQLTYNVNSGHVLNSNTKYLIMMDKEKVIAVIGLEVCHPRVTELKHLCVHPSYRRQGLGKEMLRKGIEAANTEFVYGAVRSTNHVNVRNNLRVGMTPVGKVHGRFGHTIIIFARRAKSVARIRI